MVERRTTGKKRPPNPQKVLLACWQAAIKHWCEHTANQPLYMAGKSMGGRMATLLPDTVRAAARGIICLGYPFHPPGKPEKTRTAHLQDFSSPLLICQGERDTMGCQTDVQSYTLDPNITIAWLPDGDHSLTPRKKSGYTAQDNMHTAAQTIGSWIRQHD
jgi:predicted alpha/beta-hydrolase family hydrolase